MDKKRNEISDILARLEADQCTPEELRKLDLHFEKSQDSSLDVWKELDTSDKDTIREEIFGQVTARIKTAGPVKMHRLKPWLVAATVSLLILAGFWTLVSTSNSPEEVVTRSTGAGQTLSWSLADGSRVILNAGSTLRHPETFEQSSVRRVFLEGEGFFEVTKNAEKPFEVITGGIVTRVLGTSFNIKARNNQVRVTVATGKVRVSTDDQQVTLLSDQQATSQQNEQGQYQLLKSAASMETALAWKEGKFIFDQVPLREVIEELSAVYKVRLEVDGTAAGCLVVGTYDRSSLKQILRGLQYSELIERIDWKADNHAVLDVKNCL